MQQFWLAFTRVNGLGPVRLQILRSHFESIEQAWFASAEALREAGVSQQIVDAHQTLRRQIDPEKLLEAVHRLDAWVITWDDESYPPLLREIDAPPVVLYGRGALLPEDDRAIAMIGTRRATQYGKKVTRELAQSLVQHGVCIVSGLAYGIDVTAHEAALAAGGRTIAALGCGIDKVYPSEHRQIAEQITASGAVITEFPPGTKPERGNFIIRNRIISGMTLGTVVVEAPERSGALQTANLAGEQGREVFAVPGNITSPNSQGTNRLIQDGAKLVLSGEDILEELDLAQRSAETRQTVKQIAPANALEARLVQMLALEPLHVDELCRVCNLSIKEINAALVLMELKGLVYQIAPMTYHIAG